MYKAHAWHLLAIAFVIYLAAAVIAALFALGGTAVGAVLGSPVGIVAAFLLQATLVKAVQDVRDGRADLSLGETVRAATPYFWTVAGASILAGIAITIGLILLIVPGLILITIWAVIVPVIDSLAPSMVARTGKPTATIASSSCGSVKSTNVPPIASRVVTVVPGVRYWPTLTARMPRTPPNAPSPGSAMSSWTSNARGADCCASSSIGCRARPIRRANPSR